MSQGEFIRDFISPLCPIPIVDRWLKTYWWRNGAFSTLFWIAFLEFESRKCASSTLDGALFDIANLPAPAAGVSYFRLS
jgi:hypothetical protein